MGFKRPEVQILSPRPGRTVENEGFSAVFLFALMLMILSSCNYCATLWTYSQAFRIGLSGISLLRSFKIIKRLDMAHNLSSGLNTRDNLIKGLVRHGRFVQCIWTYTSGKDSIHSSLIFLHGQTVKGAPAAHEPPRAMGGGVIPIFIAASYTNQTAITHIQGNQ